MTKYLLLIKYGKDDWELAVFGTPMTKKEIKEELIWLNENRAKNQRIKHIIVKLK
ncbi:MAG: hypothetical protein AABY22_20210 [Nanoarchaeota archaeon]